MYCAGMDFVTHLRIALSSSLLKFSGLGADADRGPRVVPEVSIWLMTVEEVIVSPPHDEDDCVRSRRTGILENHLSLCSLEDVLLDGVLTQHPSG